jgi:hypothetical protein
VAAAATDGELGNGVGEREENRKHVVREVFLLRKLCGHVSARRPPPGKKGGWSDESTGRLSCLLRYSYGKLYVQE